MAFHHIQEDSSLFTLARSSESSSSDGIDTFSRVSLESRNDSGSQIALLSPHEAKHSSQSSTSSCRNNSVTGSKEVVESTWRTLPHKKQLLILCLARLSEPIAQAGLTSYMVWQLQWFRERNGEVVEMEECVLACRCDGSQLYYNAYELLISRQAGYIAAAFTGAQCLTALPRSWASDHPRIGRKNVVLFGLLGTAFCTLGFGFSPTFLSAIAWRFFAGALNGNIAVMRTMVSELVPEKRDQSRAFSLLPAMFNVGTAFGPLLLGWFADPGREGTLAGVFGPGTSLGGAEGVSWMRQWPYALPSVMTRVIFLLCAVITSLWLEETLSTYQGGLLYGLKCWWQGAWSEYAALPQSDPPLTEHKDIQLANPQHRATEMTAPQPPPILSKWRLVTLNMILAFLSHFFIHSHQGIFQNLWSVFVATKRWDATPVEPLQPWTLAGGWSSKRSTLVGPYLS